MIYYGATATLCLPERAGSGACVDPCSHGHCPPRPGVASMHSPGSPTAMTGHVIPRMLVCSLRVFVLAVLHCSSVYHTTTRGNRLRAHRGGHSATLAWPASGRTRRHAAISSSMYSTVSSRPGFPGADRDFPVQPPTGNPGADGVRMIHMVLGANINRLWMSLRVGKNDGTSCGIA